MYTPVFILFLSLFYALQPCSAADASDWRSRSIYQIMTDRFARADGSLIAPCDPKERKYCGGTWSGITKRLDYIQNMGFTAIWISPIVQQISGETYEGEAYHGYWPQNLYALNPHFGSEQDLKDLVNACHARGMYLMVDVVINHFANQGEIVKYENFVPFSNERFFHSRCPIDWGNQTSIEYCWMGDGFVTLPDINTEDPQVIDTWKKYLNSAVSQYGIDGYRLDAVRNIPKPVWSDITRSVGVYMQGEVWDKNPNIICPYQEHMGGLHNYPFKEMATTVFTTPGGNLADLVEVAHQMQVQCKDVTLFGLFMENHDNPRLGSFTNDMARLRNLAVLNILTDGIPIVYFGQEQALTGSLDPLNREALWLTRYSTTNNIVPTFTALNNLRNYIIKSNNAPFVSTLATYNLLGNNAMSVRKGNVVLVVTNSGQGVNTDVVVEGFGGGIELVDVLACRVMHADGSGRLKVTLVGEPVVLYPASLLTGSGICSM
ncbi:alpha-amylase [Favolaschia claudopus]|uniref:alpha-amylase n=1 Tax=Favolaschia claudopus TaxID=2862362 RepID=A0AAV9ZBC1_9AGAR